VQTNIEQGGSSRIRRRQEADERQEQYCLAELRSRQ
jgi:hypothetical protein